MFNNLIKYLFNIKISFFIFIIFIIVYLVVLDEEGAFKDKFLRFGPSEDSKFLNMKLNTWNKVILVYIIGLLSSFLTSYYNNVSYDFIHSYIWNPAYTKKIKMTKGWTQIIVILEPLMYWTLGILDFFITFTMELQYIIPKFIGTSLIDIPYSIFKINQKKYIK
tara:strand:- start:1129 stop:1620 length:492 start_codon:yes stop_codon:yes gene_type:complete